MFLINNFMILIIFLHIAEDTLFTEKALNALPGLQWLKDLLVNVFRNTVMCHFVVG